MADKQKPDAHPSDKFTLAMIVMAVFLVIIIGSGFIAVEYFKAHPEVFELKPPAK